MTESKTPSQSRGRTLLAAVAAATATVTLAATADLAPGRSAKPLGQTQRTPDPLCPKDCRATGSVTGFGITADGRSGLFKAPGEGHVVAWSVKLSKPNETQLNGFGEIFKDRKFGKDPVARISVLKKQGKKRSNRFKLTKQSPVVQLNDSHLGRTPIFTLENPLRVTKGKVVALTLPTWAPLYRDGMKPGKNKWAASRKSDACDASDVPKAKPHMRKGTTRTYGCRFPGERIFYWAYFVPAEKKAK